MSQSDTNNAAGDSQDNPVGGAYKRWWERGASAPRVNDAPHASTDSNPEFDPDMPAESGGRARQSSAAAAPVQPDKRWWERPNTGSAPKPGARHSHPVEDDEPEIGLEPAPARGGYAAAVPAHPTPEAEMPASQSMPPIGAANQASRKRWWEQKDEAPAQDDAYAGPHETEEPPRTQSRPAPAYDAGDFAARQAPFGRGNRPTPEGPDNAPSRSRAIPAEAATEEDIIVPPPPRSGAFGRSSPAPSRAKPVSPTPAVKEFEGDVEDEDAPLSAAPRFDRSPQRNAPAPASFDNDDDETLDEDEAEIAAPTKARSGGLLGSLFGKRGAKAATPKRKPADIKNADDEEDDADEVGADAGRQPQAARGFARSVGLNMRADDEDAAPPGIPTPRGYSRHDSKRGPNVPRPNNVFSQNEGKAPKPKKQEHKVITMPAGPAKMAYDIDDSNRQQKQAIAARKRRQASRALKSWVGRYIGVGILAATCGALWFTGIVEINPTAATPVKINWPEQIRPTVERVTAAAGPFVSTAKEKLGEKSQPVIKQVGEMFSNPTPTPSAAKQFDFATGGGKP
jgi:hypothetical protein